MLAQAPRRCCDLPRSCDMSNEEIAVTLTCPNEMGMAEIPCDHSDGKNCCWCLPDWLRQPAAKLQLTGKAKGLPFTASPKINTNNRSSLSIQRCPTKAISITT